MQPQTLLLLPRLYLATIFLVADCTKLRIRGGFEMPMLTFLSKTALQDGFSWYKDIVSSFILPHAMQVASIVVAAELSVGIAMLIGFAVRPASAVAIFLLLNYASAKGMVPWSPASNDWADIVLCLIVAIGGAGPAYAVDAWLMRPPKVKYS